MTDEVKLDRSVAQFFFEVGYGACFAEAMISNDMKPPFELTDAHIEGAWPRSIEAHEDGAEMDRYLALADAAQSPLLVPGDDEVRATGQFLLDRLDDLDFSMSMDDFAREHAGHVDPAIARFRAAITAIPSRDDWRDIASAPRDGTEIDIWYPGQIGRAGLREANVRWNRHDGFWRRRDRTHCIYGVNPTHWMPLPKAPSASEESAK